MENYMDLVKNEVEVSDGYLSLKCIRLEKDVLFVLCPYGIGDTLYVAALIKSYKEYHKDNRRVCLIVKENHSVIAEWFTGIDEKIVSNELVELLNAYAVSTQTWQLKNFLYGHFKKDKDVWRLFPEYHEIAEKNMVSRYKQLVFQLPEEAMLEKISIQTDVDKFTEEYKIDKKTVILMPAVVSAPPMPEVFWTTLAQILQKFGYHVLTNVKDEKEWVIPGTEPISESLDVISRLGEEALLVVSVRSGICDVLALTNTLLVVINTRKDQQEEWNLSYATDREGIVSLLCEKPSEMMSVMKGILGILGIDV